MTESLVNIVCILFGAFARQMTYALHIAFVFELQDL